MTQARTNFWKWLQAPWYNRWIAGLVLILLVLTILGYVIPWSWVGVSGHVFLWDWLSALSIPGTIGGVIVGFVSTHKNAQQDANTATLQLSIGSQFLTAAQAPIANQAAQFDSARNNSLALTASVVPSLDAKHKAEALAFLSWGGHIKGDVDAEGLKAAMPHLQLFSYELGDPIAAQDARRKFITIDQLKKLLKSE